jgi:stearoyl-CoA desaturase (delta-9 desaturase)
MVAASTHQQAAETTSAPPTSPARRGALRVLRQWFDADAALPPGADADRVDWPRVIPFVGMHLACLAVFWVGITWQAVALAAGLYLIRMFIITGFYHRYFSHRTFKTSRPFQFVAAFLGCMAVQRGPMWWAAHHRHHHAHSDTPSDTHSPAEHGFWFAHTGWFLTKNGFLTRNRLIRDWLRFPELRWLDRWDLVPVFVLALATFGLGALLRALDPASGVTAWQLFVWGFIVSTVIGYHATYTINSLAHRFGSRRFATNDDSRNNLWLALLTLGEGWHNNHHHYPAAARQGFYWWEIDLTYYGLLLLKRLGLIWDLRQVPASALTRNRIDRGAIQAGRPAAHRPAPAASPAPSTGSEA